MKLNEEANLLISTAHMLINDGFSKSLRDFSQNYLNKNPNILSVIKHENLQPSIAVLLALYLKLNKEQLYPQIQAQLSKLIYQRTFL